MSKIEWTHRPGTTSKVLNPTTGCDKISRGCKFCYAEKMHKRLRGMGQPKYQQPFLGGAKYWPDELAKPFKWRKPATVFLDSMSDIFHKDITIEQIAEIYAMMFLNDKHTFIVLTKRAERARDILNSKTFLVEYHLACNRLHDKYVKSLEQEMYQYNEIMSMWPLRNVWQGVSTENQEQFDQRSHYLLQTPGWIKVFSMEPLVGPINMFKYYSPEDFKRFWVITGGESGSKASPAHPDWIRKLRDQAEEAGCAFFFKQWGEWMPIFRKHAMHDDEIVINSEGKEVVMTADERAVVLKKVGKHASGNFLDGRQHLEFPE